jgi:hypothetical protein
MLGEDGVASAGAPPFRPPETKRSPSQPAAARQSESAKNEANFFMRIQSVLIERK